MQDTEPGEQSGFCCFGPGLKAGLRKAGGKAAHRARLPGTYRRGGCLGPGCMVALLPVLGAIGLCAALLAMSLIVTFWDGNRFYNPFV